MTPDKKNYSEKVEKDKSANEILAELDKCKQTIRENTRKILRNVILIGTEGAKINEILRELKKTLLEERRGR